MPFIQRRRSGNGDQRLHNCVYFFLTRNQITWTHYPLHRRHLRMLWLRPPEALVWPLPNLPAAFRRRFSWPTTMLRCSQYRTRIRRPSASRRVICFFKIRPEDERQDKLTKAGSTAFSEMHVSTSRSRALTGTKLLNLDLRA
jgi:hypothetical protein